MNFESIARRIRRCKSEIAAQVVLECAIVEAVAEERERICAAIKDEDDNCSTGGDYMLDSDDCISVARGTWVRPDYGPVEQKP